MDHLEQERINAQAKKDAQAAAEEEFARDMCPELESVLGQLAGLVEAVDGVDAELAALGDAQSDSFKAQAARHAADREKYRVELSKAEERAVELRTSNADLRESIRTATHTMKTYLAEQDGLMTEAIAATAGLTRQNEFLRHVAEGE